MSAGLGVVWGTRPILRGNGSVPDLDGKWKREMGLGRHGAHHAMHEASCHQQIRRRSLAGHARGGCKFAADNSDLQTERRADSRKGCMG